MAEEEEKEAMALQQRMALHLDQDDFDFFEPEVEPYYVFSSLLSFFELIVYYFMSL